MQVKLKRYLSLYNSCAISVVEFHTFTLEFIRCQDIFLQSYTILTTLNIGTYAKYSFRHLILWYSSLKNITFNSKHI